MIRPSALQLAEQCGLSAQLAAEHPEESDAAANGKALHAEIAHAATTPGSANLPRSPAAIAALDALQAFCSATLDPDIRVQHELKVELRDPETNELITEGTADVVIDDGKHVTIWDWKSGRPEFVAHADDNLQLHAYALAVALDRGRESYSCRAVFLDGDKAFLGVESIVTDMWAYLARIKAAASREPIASPGDHCQRCFSRVYCPAWKARTEVALTLLPTASNALALTDEEAGALVLRAKAVKEAAEYAEELVKAHVLAGGRALNAKGQAWRPSEVKGRMGVDTDALKADGLFVKYAKQGQPFQRWGWGK